MTKKHFSYILNINFDIVNLSIKPLCCNVILTCEFFEYHIHKICFFINTHIIYEM